jgi:hypothetical protein
MKNGLHGRPQTRREFISQGLIAGGGFVMAPTLLQVLASSASAATKTAAGTIKQIPFITFDLAGGAALPGNFLVGRSGGPGDLLKSYSALGWNPRQDKIDSRFGLGMAAEGKSKILEGMLAVMSPEAQAQFRFSSFLHFAQADSRINPLSAMGLVMNSGNVGSSIDSLGLEAGASGGNSALAGISTHTVTPVTSFEDIKSSIGLTDVFSSMSEKSKGIIGQLVQRLSMTQATRLLNQKADAALLDTLGLKYQAASERASAGRVEIDPKNDEVFSQLYNLQNSTDEVRAALVKGAVSGATGPAVITINGCDYHDGTQTSGDKKDLEIGTEIGRAVEAAHRKGSPLFIHVITDGGIYPDEGTRIWRGDSSETGMSVVGFYDPGATPTYVDNRIQVGAYTEGQGADRATLIGDSPLLATYAVFANYLSVMGRVDEFRTLAAGTLSNADVSKVLTFGKGTFA